MDSACTRSIILSTKDSSHSFDNVFLIKSLYSLLPINLQMPLRYFNIYGIIIVIKVCMAGIQPLPILPRFAASFFFLLLQSAPAAKTCWDQIIWHWQKFKADVWVWYKKKKPTWRGWESPNSGWLFTSQLSLQVDQFQRIDGVFRCRLMLLMLLQNLDSGEP